MKMFTPAVSVPRVETLWQHVGLNVADGVMLVDEIDKGLEGEVANRIASWAQITQSELRRMTGIPSTTFSRNIKKRFSPDQSERLVRFIRVLDRAVDLFEGDKRAAQKWLNEPSRALGWKAPADLLASESGAWEVMRLITRLEHGVWS
ncbi:antitoxin Xre/MbcA/ParS toxin-binding domain-containing protein [Erwiniaceae bacterium CAU 1747]